MKIHIEGWLYAQHDKYHPDEPRLCFFMGTSTSYWIESGYVPICQHVIEVDTPDFDIIGGQVQCLLAKREKLTKEYEAETGKIDDAIAQLKCLTFNDKGVAV
jgi:hypothetical protein